MERKYRKRNNGKRALKLTESDVVQYMDEYFKEMESSGKTNESELVQSVIEKFYMIFQLWDENGQQSIDKKIFETVHISMSNVLNDNGNYEDILFSLKCKICGHDFPLRNKNCTYSFQSHETSKEHINFMKNLNAESDTASGSGIQTSASAEVYKFEDIFFYARCYLCSDHITFGNSKSGDTEEKAVNCVLAHLRKPNHRQNCQLFKNHQKYVEKVDLEKKVFSCELCEITLFIDELVPHFMSDLHKKLANIDRSIDNCVEKMVI